MTERRVFSSLPKYFQTDVNKRLLGATDDLVFEPEAFERIEGQIGDDTGVSEDTKARSPFIPNRNFNDNRSQLAPCVVSYAGDGSITNGSFYSDLVGHILANGGIISDESRLFECDYFSFNPPMSVDKWVNFPKYIWTGTGAAKDNGVYVSKEPFASQTTLYYVENDGSTTKKDVVMSSVSIVSEGTIPNTDPVGTLREDCTDVNRTIYRWDGSNWQSVNLYIIDDLDKIPAGIDSGTYIYVARTGKEFQRPVIFNYSEKAGRWIPKVPVISNIEPANPVDGMIWEDSRSSSRKFLIYQNKSWTPLNYSHVTTMTGIGAPTGNDKVYRYSANNFTSNDDPWQKESWWVHFEDLSPIDKVKYAGNQSSRPIIQFWAGIETYNIEEAIAQYNLYGLSSKSNQFRKPLFETYIMDSGSITKISTLNNTDGSPVSFNGNSIFEYKVTKFNTEDEILKIKPTYDVTGELVFDLTLDSIIYTKDSTELRGYRFFKDTWTATIHSVWTKSTTPLSYDQNSNDVPLNLSNNPNHDNITEISRSNIINHYRNIIVNNATGIPLGDNSYRWTDHNPINGATIIDTEGSLLIPMALVQDDNYDLADAIRNMSFEYNRFMKRFINKLNNIWKEGNYSDAVGSLNDITEVQLVDKVLSQFTLFADKDSPFWNSDMGTFIHETTDSETPIMIPPSPARVGAAPSYAPRKFTRNSKTYIIGHSGVVIDAFGDDRDDIILNLETRFYSKVTEKRKIETVNESAFLDGHQFSLRNYIANRSIKTNVQNVDDIITDYTSVVSPVSNDRYYSTDQGVFASYNGSSWVVKSIQSGDVFKNTNDDKVYFYNGFTHIELKGYNRTGSYDYETTDYAAVVRREFERWYIDQGLDPISNDIYDKDDRWTWNYHSGGFEGHWRGLYRRIYGTDRPHVAPWEIIGFTIEPEWWTDVYTADSTDSDGNKRYNDDNEMWADLKTASLIANEDITIPSKFLLNVDAPIPVDGSGNLIDPIAAGIFSLDQIINPEKNWVYGDYGPIEAKFHDSYIGSFAYALACYLMKPARFVEFLWSDYSFTIGMDQNLFGGPIKINDDTLKRPKIADLKIHSETEDFSNPGINAWIAETLNMSRIAPKEFGDMLRRSNVSLGWKTNGFIDKNATIIKTPAGVEIPFEDVQLTVHRGLPVETKFHSGLQIVKRGSKYQIFGYDYTSPCFKINYSARPSISGKTTIEETYTIQEGVNRFTLTKFKTGGSNDLAKFTVLIDGIKVKPEFINIIDNTTFEVFSPKMSSGQQLSAQLTTSLTNSITRSRKFTIGGIDYFYYSNKTNTIIEYPYGHEFSSPHEVVEFIADHGNYMNDQGWEYTDDDWIDVAKRFAVWSQSAKTGQIFVDVPSGNTLTLNSSFGHMTEIQKLKYGGYSLLDIAGIPIKDFDTFRFDEKITVKSNELIFGIRANIIDYQHAVFISNKTRFNDLVYDPFTGLRQKRLEIKTLRSKEWAGRIDTPGYIVLNDSLIPNFEKYTKDFSKYYNMHSPLSDPKLYNQAFNLYGWYYRDYMREMNINEILALKFHKNAIREKGTRRGVSGFSTAKTNEVPLEIYECWAWKEGDFGKTSFDNPVRFNLLASDFRNRIQGVVFGTTSEPNVLSITDYDRNIEHERWIVPPRSDNFVFPMNDNGPSSDYDVRVVILEDENINKKMFHYDPARGLHEPYAYSQIDIETSFDPAYYNKGIAAIDEGFEWATSRVGTLWWNTTRREYEDYSNPSLSLKKSAEKWGKLKSYSIISTTYENNTSALISVIESGHSFVADQAIIVQTKEGNRIHGIIDSISGNSVTYSLMNGPESTAILSNPLLLSDLDTITDRSIDVYEWIESKVPPNKYTSDDGDVIILNPISPSYTEITRSDGSKRYYFWVKNRKVIPKNKTLSSYQIANQLFDPTSSLLPWFGIVDKSSMIFNASSLENRNDLSLQIFTYPKQHEEHDQWALMAEWDKRNYVPNTVIEKIIDSLMEEDVNGNPVPATFRTDLDKYGSKLGQTIYPDIPAAKTVFLNSLNNVLKKYDKNQAVGFHTTFPDIEKYPNETTGYWSEAFYDTINVKTYQKVNNIAERDALIDLFVGDLVTINTIPNETYQYTESGWNKVQAENGAAKVNENIFGNLRVILSKIKKFITIEDYNIIIFDMIYEMLRQDENCNWCFKTSYIDVINTIDTGQPSNMPFDEMNVIIKSVNDAKPYHTKIRRSVASHIIKNGDNAYDLAELLISDQNYTKATLFTDRLSYNTFDDNAWDTEPFDAKAFDYQTWDHPDLGATSFEVIYTFDQSVSTNTRYYVGKTYPYLEHQVIATDDFTGRNISVPAHQFLFESEELTIVFDTRPPTDVTYSVKRAAGYATPGLLSKQTIDDDFTLFDPTYRHAVAVEGVEWLDIAGIGNTVDALDGGNADERIRGDVLDSSIIRVNTYYTGLYGGFDAMPLDIGPWDTAIAPIASNEFTININDDYADENLTETINPVIEITLSADAGINSIFGFSDGRYSVGHVEFDEGGGFYDATSSDFMVYGNHAIKLLTSLPSGTVIRLRAKSVRLKSPNFKLSNVDFETYWIEYDTVYFNTLNFDWSDSIDVTYYEDTLKKRIASLEIHNKHLLEVDDKMTDHTVMTEQSHLVSGYTVLNDTDDNIYTWNGSSWSGSLASEGDIYFVRSEQKKYTLGSGTWTELYSIGDGTQNLSYKYLGLSSGSIIGSSSIGNVVNEDGWKVNHIVTPTNEENIVAFWSVNSVKAHSYDGNIFYWSDVSGNGNDMVQDDDTKTPGYTENNNALLNSVDFATGKLMEAAADASMAGIFDATGYIQTIFKITNVAQGIIIENENIWSLSIIDTIDNGDFSLSFVHHFDSTNGEWVISNDDFTVDTDFILEIEYDNSNVMNEPTVKVNGVEISINQHLIPVGNAISGNNKINIGGTGFNLVSTLLMNGLPQ